MLIRWVFFYFLERERTWGQARGNALGWERAWNVPGVASARGGSQVCFVLRTSKRFKVVMK